jgi:hypothetical protein
MKKLFFAAVAIMAVFATSCSNSDDMTVTSQDAQGTNATRSVGVKTPKLTTYIETNDINPLNMGEYTFTGTDEQVVDHVILFASNIRGTVSTVELYHNPNQTYILNNRNTLVKPLQDKGIKVLLGLLGDHTGVGFANLTESQITSFANQVADCIEANGLDGVDFDDEYAEYGKISGTPSPSSANFSALITALRAHPKMVGKLITAFYYGGYINFNQTAKDAIDYMWPNFGVSSAPSGFANSKWARMSIQYTQGTPSRSTIQAASKVYAGYGAIMMFNVREYDASTTMNYFAPNVWGGKTVSWSGTSYPKNY